MDIDWESRSGSIDVWKNERLNQITWSWGDCLRCLYRTEGMRPGFPPGSHRYHSGGQSGEEDVENPHNAQWGKQCLLSSSIKRIMEDLEWTHREWCLVHILGEGTRCQSPSACWSHHVLDWTELHGRLQQREGVTTLLTWYGWLIDDDGDAVEVEGVTSSRMMSWQ